MMAWVSELFLPEVTKVELSICETYSEVAEVKKEEKRIAALAKLTQEEIELLGINQSQQTIKTPDCDPNFDWREIR